MVQGPVVGVAVHEQEELTSSQEFPLHWYVALQLGEDVNIDIIGIVF